MRLIDVVGFENAFSTNKKVSPVLKYYATAVNMGIVQYERVMKILKLFFTTKDINDFNELLQQTKPVKIGGNTFLPPLIITAPVSMFYEIKQSYDLKEAGIMDKGVYPRVAIATPERTATELILHRYPYRNFTIVALTTHNNNKIIRLLAYLSKISKYYSFRVLYYGKYEETPDDSMRKQIKKFIEMEIVKGVDIEVPKHLIDVDTNEWYLYHDFKITTDMQEIKEIAIKYNVPLFIIKSFFSVKTKEQASKILMGALSPTSQKFRELMDLWEQKHRSN